MEDGRSAPAAEVILGARSLPPRAQKSKAQAKLEVLSTKKETINEGAEEDTPSELDDSWHSDWRSSKQKPAVKKRKREPRGPAPKPSKGEVSLPASNLYHKNNNQTHQQRTIPPPLHTTTTNTTTKAGVPPVPPLTREDSFLPAKKKFKVLWDADRLHTGASSDEDRFPSPRLDASYKANGIPSSLPTPSSIDEDAETQLSSPSQSGSLSFDFGEVLNEWDNLDASDQREKPKPVLVS